MFKSDNPWVVRLVLVLWLGLLPAARAWSLFPDANDRAATLLRRADRVLNQADSAYEGGNPDQARVLYERALKSYEDLHQSMPGLHDGLPRYRVDYCKGQLASIARMLVDNTDEGAARAAQAALAPAHTPVTPAAPDPSDLSDPSDPSDRSDRSDPPAPPPERSPVDPGRLTADLRQARMLFEDDQLADATRLLVDVLRADPANRSARLLLALARTRQGRCDEALAALEDLRGPREDLPLLLALAAAYCGAGRTFDAMLALDQAIVLAPTHPHAYLNLAWLHLSQNRGAESRRDAEAYYRQAVKLGARRDRALEIRLGLE